MKKNLPFNQLMNRTVKSRLIYTVLALLFLISVHANAADITITGKVSDADLDLSINLLRTRGKITKLTNAFVTTNDLDMRDELRRERRIELAQDNAQTYSNWSQIAG